MNTTTPHLLRRLALWGAAGGAVALTGCSAVATNGPASAVQTTPLSETVIISQPVCAATDAPATSTSRAAPATDPGCRPYDGYRSAGRLGPRYAAFTTGGGGRLLVAVQVPDTAPDPTLALRRRPSVTFEHSHAAVSQMPDAPAGRHWVGYRSDEVRFAKDEPDAGDVVDVALAIPRGGVRPSSDELRATVAVGVQVTGNGFGAEYPRDRDVVCDEDLSDTPDHDPFIDSTTCPGQTGPATTGNNAPTSSDASITPTDATITATAPRVDVVAGDSVTAEFRIAQSGQAPEAATSAISATSSVPGARTSTSTSTIAWAGPPAAPAAPMRSDVAGRAAAPTGVSASIAVPRTTPAGSYTLTLQAADAGGSRTATVRVDVAAAPGTPPAPPATAPPTTTPPVAPAPPATPAPKPRVAPVSASVRVLRIARPARGGHLVVLGRVRCVRTKAACSVRSTLKVGTRTIGTATLRIGAKTARTIRIRLTGRDAARLRSREGRATTTVTAPGTAPIVRTTTVRGLRTPARGARGGATV